MKKYIKNIKKVQKIQIFSQVSEYLEYLEFNYHDVCHVESYGFTAEGRELKGLHIDTDHDHRGTRTADKEVIFIEAGIRPRYFLSDYNFYKIKLPHFLENGLVL